MSKGIAIVNHPNGAVQYVTRRNAERMVAHGKAAWFEELRSIRLLDRYWQDLNAKITARLLKRRQEAVGGYDLVTRMLTQAELRGVGVVSPARLLGRGYRGPGRRGGAVGRGSVARLNIATMRQCLEVAKE